MGRPSVTRESRVVNQVLEFGRPTGTRRGVAAKLASPCLHQARFQLSSS